MNVSFVIPFHSTRIANLLQTVRMLARREPALHGSEIVLVCQDETKKITHPCFDVKHFNLKQSTYNRGRAVNRGVVTASHATVVILDSDRVMPPHYFGETASSLRPRTAVSPREVSELRGACSDEDIDSGNYAVERTEVRSDCAAPEQKNLFSGNTVMWRNDFLRVGGFDEDFIGYGFNDNDMTMTVIQDGIQPLFRNELELHLFHSKNAYWKGWSMHTYGSVMCAVNSVNYMKKWGIPFDNKMAVLIQEAKTRINDAPIDLKTKFLDILATI